MTRTEARLTGVFLGVVIAAAFWFGGFAITIGLSL